MPAARRMSLMLAATLFIVAVAAGTAVAAPITVNLRVEGSTRTLFEGPVSTQPEHIATESSGGSYPCNYKENGPSSEENGPGPGEKKTFEDGGNESATPTTALHDAAIQSGLAFNAKWYGSGKSGTENPGDFFVTQVGPDVELTEPPYDAWGFAVDDTTAVVGGCQIALAPGNEVLWAYNYFNLKHLLSLTGPSFVEVGTPFTLHVSDGQDGQPIQGAAIGEDVGGVTTTIPGSPVTDANGNATILLSHVGTVKLKATQPESVRSNGFTVNVNPPPCGCAEIVQLPKAPPSPPDIARVGGVKSGYVYSRHSAPRLLAGVISVPGGGTLRDVKISLKRTYKGRCYDFSGSKESFARLKCRRPAQFFSVGGSESFSYLLPSRLAPGKYLYEIEAVNDAGQATKPVNGVSRIVFTVR